MEREKLLAHAVIAGMRLSADEKPSHADALYIHALSRGMCVAHRIFKTAGSLMLTNSFGVVSYNGSDGRGIPPQDRPGAAWPGAKYYETSLPAVGISERLLVPTGPGLHTRDEADKLVALAKERGWKSVVVLSVSYHAVRAMSCHVAAMHAAGYLFRVYYASPRGVDWSLPMGGSQGLKETTSREEIHDELERILKYWERGSKDEAWRQQWGAPPDMLFHYLDTIRPGLP